MTPFPLSVRLWQLETNPTSKKMLAQLLRQNGCSQVTIAAPQGLKMDLARSLDAADTYVELSRSDPGPQFEQIKKDNPYGFDIVIEATGSVKILEDAINYCRRGGTLVVYGFVFLHSLLPSKERKGRKELRALI